VPVRLLRPPERKGEAPPVAPVRDRTLAVAVAHAMAPSALARSVGGAAQHAAKPVAKRLLQAFDGFRVALLRGQREVFAGEEQFDGIGEESLAEHLAELVLRRVVAIQVDPFESK
jgi:hypothetical protein